MRRTGLLHSLADSGLCVEMSIRRPFSVSLQRNQTTLEKGWWRISAHTRLWMNSLNAETEVILLAFFFPFSAHLSNELN